MRIQSAAVAVTITGCEPANGEYVHCYCCCFCRFICYYVPVAYFAVLPSPAVTVTVANDVFTSVVVPASAASVTAAVVTVIDANDVAASDVVYAREIYVSSSAATVTVANDVAASDVVPAM